jgi:hypothetical protein
MEAVFKLFPERCSRVLVFGFEFIACVHALVKLAFAPDAHLQPRADGSARSILVSDQPRTLLGLHSKHRRRA